MDINDGTLHFTSYVNPPFTGNDIPTIEKGIQKLVYLASHFTATILSTTMSYQEQPELSYGE